MMNGENTKDNFEKKIELRTGKSYARLNIFNYFSLEKIWWMRMMNREIAWIKWSPILGANNFLNFSLKKFYKSFNDILQNKKWRVKKLKRIIPRRKWDLSLELRFSEVFLKGYLLILLSVKYTGIKVNERRN